MLSSPLIIWQKIIDIVGGHNTTYILLGLQIVTYVALIISCVLTIKVIQAKRMNVYGWGVLFIIAAFAVYMMIRGVVYLSRFVASDPIYGISNIFIRLFDMAVILMLVPVVVLYIQHMRAKAQESITFTMIMIGLVITILSSYVVEVVTDPFLKQTLSDITDKYFQTGSWLDVVNIFGYLLIAAGMFAHMKYDEWGFREIEKALGQNL